MAKWPTIRLGFSDRVGPVITMMHSANGLDGQLLRRIFGYVLGCEMCMANNPACIALSTATDRGGATNPIQRISRLNMSADALEFRHVD